MIRRRTRSGFTIVEFTLSTAFISVLLLSIAALIIFTTGVYQKGLTVKSVNSTGRQLIDGFTRTIAASASPTLTDVCTTDACRSDGAFLYTYYQRLSTVVVGTTTYSSVPVNGIFCTGSYSYIWNTGYALNAYKANPTNDYRVKLGYAINGSHTTLENFRLLRFSDPNRALCKQAVNTSNYSSTYNTIGTFEMGTLVEPPEELISSNDNSLALFDLKIFRPTQHSLTRQVYYSGTFILATLSGGVDITSSGGSCAAANDVDDAFDANYCAINKFNFAARATGETYDN